MLLRSKFSGLHLYTLSKTLIACRDIQLRFLKVKTLLNNAFKPIIIKFSIVLYNVFSCEANVTLERQLVDDVDTLPTCALKSRPSLAIVLIHLFSMFGAGIAMSMWVWTPSTVAIWKRMWRKWVRLKGKICLLNPRAMGGGGGAGWSSINVSGWVRKP